MKQCFAHLISNLALAVIEKYSLTGRNFLVLREESLNSTVNVSDRDVLYFSLLGQPTASKAKIATQTAQGLNIPFHNVNKSNGQK